MRRRGWQRRKRLLLGTVTIVTVALSLAAYATGFLYPLDAKSIDARFRVRGSRASLTSDFVVVQVDQATLNYFVDRDLAAQWPFPRGYDATVINRLRSAGARLIAFDVQFTEPESIFRNNALNIADDNALIEAIGRAHNMVLATDAVDRSTGQTGVLGGPAVLAKVGARAGDSTVLTDSTGVIRDMQYSYQPPLASFAVAIASVIEGHKISPHDFGGVQRPVPVDYAGPPGTVPAISYWRAYSGSFPREAVAGKVVIVGASAPDLQDEHATPTSGGELMDGPEVQANAAATVLGGIPLRDGPTWLNVVLIVLFASAAPLSSIRARVWRALLASLGLAALFTIATQLAFDDGTIVSYAYPIFALVLAIMATLAVVLIGEAFERQRARSIFARFVPPGVVEEVLARTDEDFRLKGVERDCTVLFSDLRDFTTFSESQPAGRVIEVINFYLNEMTESILGAGGTVIAYMGDGIMAVFGAPIDQPDHADRALAAAREMIGARLDRFNVWLRDQGYKTTFRIGIGLNSGRVMAGTVGSAHRVEYSAVGDTTNTASRLEAMTKGTSHMLFVADTTRQRLRQVPDDLVFVDDVVVRGRASNMAIYSLADSTSDHEIASPGDEQQVDTSGASSTTRPAP